MTYTTTAILTWLDLKHLVVSKTYLKFFCFQHFFFFFLETPEVFSQIRWNLLRIITTEECSNYMTADETILCTFGTDSNLDQAPCGVTDGSSLAYVSNNSWIQIGIGNWPSCRSNAPGKFTNVRFYLDWLAEVTGITN